MKPNICLGSAQFGIKNYGITNKKGKLRDAEVRNILDKAKQNNINLIDTAKAYGDSEQILGNSMETKNKFKIISKLPKQNTSIFTEKDKIIWESNFQSSLKKLKKKKLEGFLLHNSQDLFKEGSIFLKDWLYSLKKRGLTKSLGLSIYSNKEIKNIDLDFFNIIQLPLSLYDQRLLNDGTITYLKKNKCNIYARSIFIQGLLLESSTNWPKWINTKTLQFQKNLEAFAKERNFTLMELALGFIKEQQDISAAIMGLTSVKELNEIISVWGKDSPWLKEDTRKWSIKDINFIDPRNWPKE